MPDSAGSSLQTSELSAWSLRNSQEFALLCDAEGNVLAADERASKLLEIEPEATLTAFALTGVEEKIRRLCSAAVLGPVTGYEVSLGIRGRPRIVRCATEPRRTVEGSPGFFLLGSLLPDQLESTTKAALDALHVEGELNRQIARQARELLRLNAELADSNQGIVQLHDELSQKAEEAATTAEVKSRLVANVSHEFRTPIHSILGLSQLLLDEADGPLVGEQRTQVSFIRSAAEELAIMVNDMLDLAKVDSGVASIRSTTFDARELVEGLRGTLKPLIPEDGPQLIFEGPEEPIPLETDRSKLAQVLRNLLANAIKYTERGEVRLRLSQGNDEAIFEVIDTGIGVAQEHLPRIFEEFFRSPTVAHTRGTGLGLPISKRLTEFLGGNVTVESEVGKGSTFTVRLPKVHPEVKTIRAIQERERVVDPTRSQILVVEDDRKTFFVYERYLTMAGFQVILARSIEEARETLQTLSPAAIVLDIMLEGQTSWQFLTDLKSSEETRDIPVLVVTVMNQEKKARALGADEFWLKPLDESRLIRRLEQLAPSTGRTRVLVIDDDERARYLISKFLEGTKYELFLAATGDEGIQLALERKPHVIMLDFLLDTGTAFDVLDVLKSDPRTRPIPVIVISAHALGEDEKSRLANTTESVLSKVNLSRELAISRIRDALEKAGIQGRKRA